MSNANDWATRGFRMEIPGFVDYLDLDSFEYRLYSHYIRVCGQGGLCWEATETTARFCHMSVGKVSQARRALAELGLIEMEQGYKYGKRCTLVRVSDVWALNLAFRQYLKEGRKPLEECQRWLRQRLPGENQTQQDASDPEPDPDDEGGTSGLPGGVHTQQDASEPQPDPSWKTLSRERQESPDDAGSPDKPAFQDGVGGCRVGDLSCNPFQEGSNAQPDADDEGGTSGLPGGVHTQQGASDPLPDPSWKTLSRERQESPDKPAFQERVGGYRVGDLSCNPFQEGSNAQPDADDEGGTSGLPGGVQTQQGASEPQPDPSWKTLSREMQESLDDVGSPDEPAFQERVGGYGVGDLSCHPFQEGSDDLHETADSKPQEVNQNRSPGLNRSLDSNRSDPNKNRNNNVTVSVSVAVDFSDIPDWLLNDFLELLPGSAQPSTTDTDILRELAEQPAWAVRSAFDAAREKLRKTPGSIFALAKWLRGTVLNKLDAQQAHGTPARSTSPSRFGALFPVSETCQVGSPDTLDIPSRFTCPPDRSDYPIPALFPSEVHPCHPVTPSPCHPATGSLPEANAQWNAVLTDLMTLIPANIWHWLQGSHVQAAVDGVWTVALPNAHGLDWCRNRLAASASRRLAPLLGRPIQLEFTQLDPQRSLS